jgi:hypothetical protein
VKTTRAISLVALSAACVAHLALAGCAREPSTPEQKRARGDEIIRQMSDRLARATTFAVEATDVRQRNRGGQRVTLQTTRHFTVRRPDRVALQITGDAKLKGWYDGAKVTLVSDSDRVWARVSGGATIDETLDRLAERLAMPMPVADFLYSSPYDALIGSSSTGGYVGREAVDGVATLHLAYQHPAVDWDLWVAEQGDPLPVKYRVVDKSVTPPRVVEVRFASWKFDVPADPSTFTPQVPSGYERIPLAVQAEDVPATQ